jgi:hypothetical protein
MGSGRKVKHVWGYQAGGKKTLGPGGVCNCVEPGPILLEYQHRHDVTEIDSDRLNRTIE